MAMAVPPYVQVMEDLLQGQGLAEQLRGLLRHSPEAGLLTDQILSRFARAIRAVDDVVAKGSEAQSEVTSGGSGKRKASAGGGGGADGKAPTRRRTHQSAGVTKTMKSLDDGGAWRKYGQKEIHNSKHPKAYFRCTHKFDQHCQAQRQVQRCDDDPDTFRVTYIGVHTCRDPAAVAPHDVIHQAAAAADGLHAGSRLISFAPAAAATPATTASTTTTGGNNHSENGAPGSIVVQSQLKQEGGEQEEVVSSLTPGSSAVRGGGGGTVAGAAVAAAAPDLGDVTSTLNYDGGIDEFDMGKYCNFDDYVFGLDDILPDLS